jgi:hypothetical protein
LSSKPLFTSKRRGNGFEGKKKKKEKNECEGKNLY